MTEPVAEPKKESWLSTAMRFFVKEPSMPTVEQGEAAKISGPVEGLIEAGLDAVKLKAATPTLGQILALKITGAEEVRAQCGELAPSVAKSNAMCNAADAPTKGR